MCGVILAVQAYDFNDSHLEGLVESRDGIIDAQDILNCFWHGTMGKKDERVSLAGGVCLSNKKGEHKFWGVWNEMLKFSVN